MAERLSDATSVEKWFAAYWAIGKTGVLHAHAIPFLFAHAAECGPHAMLEKPQG